MSDIDQLVKRFEILKEALIDLYLDLPASDFDCPKCRSSRSKRIFIDNMIEIYKCSKCGTYFKSMI